jgi:transposase InsO family protein
MVMTGKNGEHKVVTNVYYIPKLQTNIISLGQLEEAGCKVVLEDGWLQIFDRVDQGRKRIVNTLRTSNRLYKLQIKPTTPVSLMLSVIDTAWLWHSRFGHLNFKALRELGRKDMVKGIPVVDHVEQVCEGCTLGKQHRAPFPRASSYRAQKGLELFHTDLCGQITPTTPGGKAYFMLVVDDHSRYMWIELLRSKDEALACLKKVKARAENEKEGKLKAVRTDQGGEFNSKQFTVFCNEFGIKHYTTTPYTP